MHKKFVNSDWFRALQCLGNASAKNRKSQGKNDEIPVPKEENPHCDFFKTFERRIEQFYLLCLYKNLICYGKNFETAIFLPDSKTARECARILLIQ